MKEKIIEKQDEIIANLKEVGQLYFRIKDKATKQDVARMTSLTTKGRTLESELIILKAQDISVETTINQEVEKRIAEKMPSSPEIFQFVKSNLPWLIKSKRGNLQYPFVSVHANEEIEKHLSHALFEWLRSRLTEKPNNSQKTEGGEGCR
jgi:hypothetical protein